jgi:hypothetical protein
MSDRIASRFAGRRATSVWSFRAKRGTSPSFRSNPREIPRFAQNDKMAFCSLLSLSGVSLLGHVETDRLKSVLLEASL